MPPKTPKGPRPLRAGPRPYGRSTVPPGGQVSIPVELRRDFGYSGESIEVEVWGDVMERKIVLVELVDDQDVDEPALEARLKGNVRHTQRTRATPSS